MLSRRLLQLARLLRVNYNRGLGRSLVASHISCDWICSNHPLVTAVSLAVDYGVEKETHRDIISN